MGLVFLSAYPLWEALPHEKAQPSLIFNLYQSKEGLGSVLSRQFEGNTAFDMIFKREINNVFLFMLLLRIVYLKSA